MTVGQVPAHDQAETIHLQRHYEPHHARQGDPEWPLFQKAKRRIKKLGLWKCIIDNEDCKGYPTLHHALIEFSYEPEVDLDRLNQLLGMHLDDAAFHRYVVDPGQLEVLCQNHHLPGWRFAAHSIPHADWTIVRVHRAGLVPVEVVRGAA